MSRDLRADALAIFHAGIAAVEPAKLVREAFAKLPAEVLAAIAGAPRIHVAGGGKACAAMAAGLEQALGGELARVAGAVNVPAGCRADVSRIKLNEARAVGSNLPTPEGVAFTRAMLEQFAAAGPNDVAICLISGGGSALLTCPAEGVTLEDKVTITRQLQSIAGQTIGAVNAVRTQLSAVKGGRLAAAFSGELVLSFILSDVIGDPLSIIASGPTVPDITTAEMALHIIQFDGVGIGAERAVRFLEANRLLETPAPAITADVRNSVVGNNQTALAAATEEASRLGYRVINLGSHVQGKTGVVAEVIAGIVESVRADGLPVRPPACILIGGETTVKLPRRVGKGGRNTHFALALLHHLTHIGGLLRLQGICVLSAGTDGEDGPTDAAGATGDYHIAAKAHEIGEWPLDYLRRKDSYTYFEKVGGLIQIGLTGTNVADIRLVLIV